MTTCYDPAAVLNPPATASNENGCYDPTTTVDGAAAEDDDMKDVITVRSPIVFDGTAGKGALGTVTMLRHVGQVHVEDLLVVVQQTLVGGAAQLALGTPNSPTAFISNTAIAALSTATPLWVSNSPFAEVGAAPSTVKDIILNADILVRIQTHSVDSGQLLLIARYTPYSSDGELILP